MTHQQLLALLDSLSVEEKAGQLSQIPLSVCASGVSEPTGPMMSFHLTPMEAVLSGSLICDRMGDAEEFARVVREMTAAHPHHIPPVLMRDMIHGTKTIFPIPLAMGCTFDDQLAEEMARITAKEAAFSGIHATFAPMVDLVRDPRWGRVMESPGEAPLLCANMGAAMVRGFRGAGVDQPDTLVTCAKHYAAYGLCQAGQDYAPVDVGYAELYNVYLPPFKAALDAGCDMVMPSFICVNRVPCVCNQELLTDVLRDWWHSDAMTISDYADVEQLINHGLAENRKEAAELCLNAGCDMDMMSSAFAKYIPELVAEGRLGMAQVDAAVLRVLELKNRLGLFENPVKHDDREQQAAVCMDSAHGEAALRAALRSCVLLKNEGVLPLKAGVKLHLTGDHADERDLLGDWAGDGIVEETQTLREAFLQEGRAALVPEKDADVILYAVGENGRRDTGEGASKAHPELNQEQLAELRRLHALGKPVVMVLFTGRPLLIGEALPSCAAVLNAFFPGSAGAKAIVQLLMGEANPSGHLSMTVPRCVGQIPIHHDRLTSCRPNQPGNSYSNSYLDEPNEPLYPFGYGLSYTTFAFENARLDQDVLLAGQQATLSVDVENTGGCYGETVVQLYARMQQGPILRPMRTLIGYARVALEAGERKTVSLGVTQEMLSMYDVKRNLIAPRGVCHLAVGECSDVPFTLKLRCE